MFKLKKQSLIAIAIGSLALTGCLSGGGGSSSSADGSGEEVVISAQQ